MSEPQSATRAVTEYVLGAQSLPADVKAEAIRSFVNIVGCTVGGAHHAAVDAAWRGRAPFAGAAQCTVLGRGTKTDALAASFLNTLSSSVYTYDDTHAEAIVHPAGPIMGTVLAIAERQTVSGAELLMAFALGVEIVCRLSKAVSVAPAKGTIAWSQTGICSGIGAALAAARLLRLDVETTRHAVGIAAGQASGIRAMHGSMCTSGLPAFAAEVGLRSACLAAAGFTSSRVALEAQYGFVNCFSVAPHLAHLTDGLGERFDLLGNTYKPYPCGIVIHPIIDAVLALRCAHGLEGPEVEAVTVRAAPVALALCDRPSPKDEFEGQVSLQHWVAAALTRGRAGIRECEESAIADPTLAAFRSRVTPIADSSVPHDGADVTIVLKDGRTLTERVRNCTGSRRNPMTDSQLDAKFLGQAEGVLAPDRAKALLAGCRGIADLSDAALLLKDAA
jgi:2-methylcitrate dehydratase PrpD